MMDQSIPSLRTRRVRFPVVLPALALLAAGALAPAGCVSKAQYTQVAQERDLCTTRYEGLRSQMENADRTGMTLAQEKSALATEKTVLEAKVATLQTEGEELGSKLREREAETRKLQETYDGLVKNLQKELKSGQVEVTQLRDGLRVNVAQDILFDSGSAALDRSGTVVLNKVATPMTSRFVRRSRSSTRPTGSWPGPARRASSGSSQIRDSRASACSPSRWPTPGRSPPTRPRKDAPGTGASRSACDPSPPRGRRDRVRHLPPSPGRRCRASVAPSATGTPGSRQTRKFGCDHLRSRQRAESRGHRRTRLDSRGVLS